VLTGDQTVKRKFIYRFLPTSLALELAYELLILRPAQEFIARMLQDQQMEHRLRYRIFPGVYKDLDTPALTKAFREVTFKYLGYEVGISQWRTAQANFCDKFWKYVPQQIDIQHYVQRGHGEETGRSSYTGTDAVPSDTPGTKISGQLGASRCWQDLAGAYLRSRTSAAWLTLRLTGIEPLSDDERVKYGADKDKSLQAECQMLSDVTTRAGDAGRVCISAAERLEGVLVRLENLGGIPTTSTRDLNAAAPAQVDRQDGSEHPAPGPLASGSGIRILQRTEPNEEIPLPGPRALHMLRTFLDDERAWFTCPEQAQALELATTGDTSFFVVMSTGSGKTSAYMVPAKIEPHKVTIVILPLSGLRIDFAFRCENLRIDCQEWTPGHHPHTTMVMVSPENVQRDDFLTWATNLHLCNQLRLIVYDEVHLVETHSHFRPCFEDIHRIVGIGMPNT